MGYEWNIPENTPLHPFSEQPNFITAYGNVPESEREVNRLKAGEYDEQIKVNDNNKDEEVDNLWKSSALEEEE